MSSREDEQVQAIIVDYWKRIGVRAQIKNLPPRGFNSEEFRNRWAGAALGGQNMNTWSMHLWDKT